MMMLRQLQTRIREIDLTEINELILNLHCLNRDI
jgi:hypothetical protein